MREKEKTRVGPARALLLILLLAALVYIIYIAAPFHRGAQPDDPHAGQVQVYDGYSYVWFTPEEGVPVSSLKASAFFSDELGRPVYSGDDYDTVYGVDVADYQGDVDWQQVASSGVRFAIVRVGGRGYGSSGETYIDGYFAKNIEGASAAGLKVGVYFFSQAVNTDEARQEAQLVIDALGGFEPSLPVFFDWERIGYDEARTDGVTGEELTELACAFCKTIEKAGLQAGVYMNPDLAYNSYTLKRLCDYTLWYAYPAHSPDFYYAHELWQYSFEGSVPGIDAKCDLDMMFIKK